MHHRSVHIAALCALLCLAAAPFVARGDDVSVPTMEGDVMVLTTKNFDATIKSSKYALVEFYAPWCSHCQHLEPHYAAAATEIKAYNPDIILAKVDAIQEGALAQFFEVSGLPTLKWIEDGDLTKPIAFTGERNQVGIVNWIKRKTMPVATTVDTMEVFKAIERNYPILVVAYFEEFKGYEYSTFISVAKTIPDVTFIQTSNAEVAKAAGLEQPGTISALKTFVGEDRLTVFSGEIESLALKAFIFAEKMPTVIDFHPTTSDKIFRSAIQNQVFLWAKKKDLKPKSAVFKAFREAAKELKGKVVFATLDNQGEHHESLTSYFDIKDTEGPLVLGLYMDPTQNQKNKKYLYDGELSVEGIKAFAQSVLHDTAPQLYKSAPLPEEPMEGGVTVVVGKNFDDIVLDPTKDVLLEVYTPTCDHCKELVPIYSKLASRFRSAKSVVIAKMDASTNEHARVNVQGYPALLFFPAEEDSWPTMYDNGEKPRTLKAMTQFIKDNARIPFELPKKASKEEL